MIFNFFLIDWKQNLSNWSRKLHASLSSWFNAPCAQNQCVSFMRRQCLLGADMFRELPAKHTLCTKSACQFHSQMMLTSSQHCWGGFQPNTVCAKSCQFYSQMMLTNGQHVEEGPSQTLCAQNQHVSFTCRWRSLAASMLKRFLAFLGDREVAPGLGGGFRYHLEKVVFHASHFTLWAAASQPGDSLPGLCCHAPQPRWPVRQMCSLRKKIILWDVNKNEVLVRVDTMEPWMCHVEKGKFWWHQPGDSVPGFCCYVPWPRWPVRQMCSQKILWDVIWGASYGGHHGTEVGWITGIRHVEKGTF